jgi:alcohol dehydrogenase, propanol-preferring
MKAAVVRPFDKPLTIEDVPKPKADSGEVVVKIETCGLCHSDIHAARGDWPFKPNLPLIPGHEAVGIVESVGDGVKEVKEGDRVAIPWMGYACGSCRYCVSGWETRCEQQVMTGYLVDGGYAEYAKANARFVGKVPNGVDPLAAGPLTCAGVTTYKAVKVSGAGSSDLVAVFGVGGLGHLAVQYAAIAGATVVAVDLFEEKLNLAKELGATYTIDASKANPIEEIKKLGGADFAICVPFRQKHLNKPSDLFVAVEPPCSLGFPLTSTCSYRFLRLWETISKSWDRLWGIESIWLRRLSFTRQERPR